MLVNDTYNHKGTVEILTNISKQLATIVQRDSEGEFWHPMMDLDLILILKTVCLR